MYTFSKIIANTAPDTTLESLIAYKEDFQRTLPQQLKKIDLERKNLVYEPIQPLEGDIEQ